MAKPQKRIEARKLRQQGNSINFITKNLNVSKSSVSKWCSDITLSPDQTSKLNKKVIFGQKKGSVIAAQNKRAERIDRMKKHQKIGRDLIGNISEKELNLIGTALYWAEGTKSNRRTVFSNSDPIMIQLYIKWLTMCLRVEHSRLKCYVGINQIHQHRKNEVKQYWSKISGIDLGNFTKTSIKKVKNKKIYSNKSKHYGTLTIEVRSGTNLNYQILGQIDALKKSILPA